MGACLSAERVADTESTCCARSGTKGTLSRAPLTTSGSQKHGRGHPAAAIRQAATPILTTTLQVQQLLLPTYKAPTATGQPTEAASAIPAAIATHLALDPQADTQSAEAQGTTAPVDGSGALQNTHEAAAATGTMDWRLAPTVTVTLQSPSIFKVKAASGEDSAQALVLSRHNFVPLTLAWTTAAQKCTILKDLCIRLDQKCRKEQAGKHAAVGALAASAQLAADQVRQLSTEQESLRAVEETLRGKDEALAAATAEAACLQRELDEQRGEKDNAKRQLRAAQAQLAQQECQLSAAQVQLAEQACQLSAASAQLAQQEARLSLLPKTMARAAEMARQLAAAESATANAEAKLKAQRRKGLCLAWMLRKTEQFAQALEALHDDLPHLSEDDLTTIGILGQGGFAQVDHKAITYADGSTADVAVKVVLPPEQPAAAAAADTSPAATDASSDDSPAPSSAANSDADSEASSACDPAPAAACSIAPATCESDKDEEDGSDTDGDEDQDSDTSEDEKDGSESTEDAEEGSDIDEDEEEDAEEVDVSDEALQASIKLRALRLEGAVLNKLRGQPCILGAQAWQGEGHTGLVLPLAKGGSLKDVLWPVPGDRGAFVPQDRDQVLRIAGGLCTALQAAHVQGVAHLDVKADNLLLDTNLNVQLADWGTAAPLSFTTAQWRARGIMGSAGLIFPGVLYNPESGGVRHDVYAAGALCYGMLTGRDYAHECWEQYRALPKATRKAICKEAADRCERLGYSGFEPTSIELLMVAQLRGYVGAVQVEQHLRLLGGARMPEPLASLACWTQQALCMVTWRRRNVTLQDMQTAIYESWQQLHLLA